MMTVEDAERIVKEAKFEVIKRDELKKWREKANERASLRHKLNNTSYRSGH